MNFVMTLLISLSLSQSFAQREGGHEAGGGDAHTAHYAEIMMQIALWAKDNPQKVDSAISIEQLLSDAEVVYASVNDDDIKDLIEFSATVLKDKHGTLKAGVNFYSIKKGIKQHRDTWIKYSSKEKVVQVGAELLGAQDIKKDRYHLSQSQFGGHFAEILAKKVEWPLPIAFDGDSDFESLNLDQFSYSFWPKALVKFIESGKLTKNDVDYLNSRIRKTNSDQRGIRNYLSFCVGPGVHALFFLDSEMHYTDGFLAKHRSCSPQSPTSNPRFLETPLPVSLFSDNIQYALLKSPDTLTSGLPTEKLFNLFAGNSLNQKQCVSLQRENIFQAIIQSQYVSKSVLKAKNTQLLDKTLANAGKSFSIPRFTFHFRKSGAGKAHLVSKGNKWAISLPNVDEKMCMGHELVSPKEIEYALNYRYNDYHND